MSEDEPAWYTATCISERWESLPVGRVIQIIELLGMRGSTHHTRRLDGRTEGSPAAVGLIERELRSRGYQRAMSDGEADALSRGFVFTVWRE